ncbi:MAG: hypothetical protein K2N22_04815, partial [Clostridia bacterium]|nr:hypothetical protein [Clostridia bacterium]
FNMKKFLAAILGSLCLFASGCGLFSCDDRVDKVIKSCPVHGDSMRLPVNFKAAYAEGDFTTGDTLEDIKSSVEKISEKGAEYSAEIYGGRFLFIEKYTGGEVHYFVVVRLKDGFYKFTCPESNLTEEDHSAESFYTLTPFHLFYVNPEYAEENFYNCFYGTRAGKEYKLTGTEETVVEFYEKAGIFNVEEDGKSIIVSVKENAEIYSKYFALSPFEIRFITKDDGVYAVYSIIEQHH